MPDTMMIKGPVEAYDKEVRQKHQGPRLGNDFPQCSKLLFESKLGCRDDLCAILASNLVRL